MRLLAILLCLLPLAFCLRCKSCRKIGNVEREPKCESDCMGDACVLWTDKDEKTIMQGCLSGVKYDVKMGCRRNHVDATLCLCNDGDHCNDVTALQSNTVTILPKISCTTFFRASYIPRKNNEMHSTCEGSYCFYHKNIVTNFAGYKETQTQADCSQLPQFTFDIQVATIWPGPGAVSGACYLLQAAGTDTTLGCMCDTEECNKQQPFEVPHGKVRCHQTYNVLEDSKLQNETCYGQFCLVQKIMDPTQNDAPRYTKGCITVSKDGIITPGYRNILGVEQWFCNTDFCNKNAQTAAEIRTEMMIRDEPIGAGSRNFNSLIFGFLSLVLLAFIDGRF